MKKYLIAIIFMAFIASLAACSRPGELPPEARDTPLAESLEPDYGQIVVSPGELPPEATDIPSPNSSLPALTATTHLNGEPLVVPEPDIPAIVDELDFGIPVGNGVQPGRVAVDSRRRHVYTMNYGVSALKEGNTISVLDLETGKITALLKLHNMGESDFSPPDPLDLQVDPYRPRLYAVWGNRYGDVAGTSLTIIDIDTLAIIDTLPGIEAIAPGPDRLYLASDTRLWTVDPDSLVELEAHDLDPRELNLPLLLNPRANRLYLGRGYPWSLEVFNAGLLTPVDSYPIAGRLVNAVVDTDGERLFILESDGEQVVLRAMNADGHPLADPAPVPITERVYSDLPLALDGQILYAAQGDYASYQLQAFALPDLLLLDSFPLPNWPDDLAIDSGTGLLYAVYPSPSSYVLTIDPATGSAESIHTALTVADALADPATGRLYVLDDGGTLRVLSLAGYRQTARVETGFNPLPGYYDDSYGQLSLDPSRNRLYVDGDPLRVVDTGSLQMIAHPDVGGQVTPDPTSDRVYLTPPCQCRLEQCNTLILSAETLTGTETLFPPEDPFTAPCVVSTSLDPDNQLLYAQIYNGTPGSNSGDYFSVFDVSGPPEELYTDFQISYGNVAFDPLRQRAFMPRYRMDRAFIDRFQARGRTITQTLELAGAYGQLAYDPPHDRLYAVQDGALQVLNGDLALLAEISLPGKFDLLTFDPPGQRLYLKGADGNLLVVATGGGQLEPPPPVVSTSDQPQVQRLLVAPDGTLFRVYDWRLYRSDDGGQAWHLLGQGLPGRAVAALAISPNYEKDHTLLVGLGAMGRAGGLYRSTDGGDTWHPTTRDLTDIGISEILFSPTFDRDQTIFLTTQDQGLFRSTDGADTWVPLADRYATDLFDREVSHLAISPTFADEGLIIISYRNLLLSTDGGDTWLNTGVPGGVVAFSPNFARDHLVLSEGRWRSTDGGHTWQPAAVGLEPAQYGAQRILFSPNFAADQTVYILLRQDHDAPLVLQRSVDAGRSWESLLGGLPPNFQIAAAALLPAGELDLTALDGRQVTTPAHALEWGKQSGAVDVTQIDLEDLAIAPDGTIFVANAAAGVFKSTDAGRSWSETNFPARAAISHQAHLAVADDGTLFAGVGTVIERSPDGGQTWTHLPGLPLGFHVASLAVSPDFAQDRVVVAGGDYTSNQIIRSPDGGKTWEIVFDAGVVEGASDISAMAFSPNSVADGRLYAWLQYGGLLNSTDSGRSWSLVASDRAGEYYGQSLVVSPAGNRLYLGALNGHVLVSEDDGRGWVDLRQNIPDDRTWSTALAFGVDGALFLGTDVGAYRSRDGGQTWDRISAGLPVRPDEGTPQAVRALRLSGNRLYAALAQGGLFVSDDLGESWRNTISGQAASPIQTHPPLPTPGTQPPTRTTSQTPTPADCPAPPDYFAPLWAERVAQLGCPVASYSLLMVEQSFEGGWMFWRSDTADIYVLPSGQPYARFDDTWDEGKPIYSCPDLSPSQTPPTPHRGFGVIWCRDPQVRQNLGNATNQERLFDATLQEFDSGLIFKTDQGATYVLESRSNAWEQVKQ
jgi:photosystem II stability/assembly factor-like uncharacterized protein/DNA-binding beta-propeller fold protein YncE/predicted small lipoprotein YifL